MRSLKLRYVLARKKSARKLLTRVGPSPGRLGSQISFTNLSDVGSCRAFGITLPANGVRTYAPFSSRVVLGSKIVRKPPSIFSDREKSPSRSSAVGKVITR